MPNAENQVHWSTDFVEHARTVHFALLAVCVTVIGAVWTEHPSEIASARIQLQDIKDAAANWKALKGEMMQARHAIDGPRIFIEGEALLLSPDPVLLTAETYAAPLAWESFSTSMNKPENFKQFCEAWDVMEKHKTIVIPDHSRIARSLLIVGKTGTKKIDYSYASDETATPLLIESLSADEQSALARFQMTDGGKPYSYGYHRDVKDGAAILPVHSEAHEFDAQKIVILAHSHLKPGTCAASFRELRKAAGDSSEKSFEDIESDLEQEAAKEKADSFEIMGVSVPIESVGRWGLLLIVGIQLYLWIQLHELSSRLKDSDPGWDVAWIGVYRSLAARSLFFFLTVLLPIWTIYILGRYARVYSAGIEGQISTIVAGLASLCLSLSIFMWAPRHWVSPTA